MTAVYEIKSIKNFKGHEGEPCSQGNLCKNGKKVCEWSDDSWGGPMSIRFTSAQEEAAFAVFAKGYLDGKLDILDKPFKVADMNAEMLASEAVEHMAMAAVDEAQMRKECAKGLTYTVKSRFEGGEPELIRVNTMYTEGEIARLKKEVPDHLEIVNARFGAPYKDGSPEHVKAEAAFYSRACKTKTLYVKMHEGFPGVFTLNKPFSPQLAAQIRAKVSGVMRIINEG